MTGNEFIDSDTMKKLKEYEKANPMISQVKEIEQMLSKCSDTIYGLQEHFTTKAFLTDNQLLMLKSISQVINVRSGAITVSSEVKNGAVGIETDKELIKRCLAQNPTSNFFISVADFYNKNGRISDKQREALLRNSSTSVAPAKAIDTESVEYKETQAFLLKCESTFPESNFVKSVKEQFVRNGRITDKQRASLSKTLKEAEDKIKLADEDKIKIATEDKIKIATEVVSDELVPDEVLDEDKLESKVGSE